jgi:tetratricopeptide (TPR) repeat protein
LHEARRYAAALSFFDRATRVAPDCPLVVYNRANTLYMLERDAEAYPLLRGLIEATPEELDRRCPFDRPRSLHLDAHYLLFLVVVHGRGVCAEAFEYAMTHLRLRRRGVQSLWPVREVRSTIKEVWREWKGDALAIEPRRY